MTQTSPNNHDNRRRNEDDRYALKEAHRSRAWYKKVDRMSDAQVAAIKRRLQNQNKL